MTGFLTRTSKHHRSDLSRCERKSGAACVLPCLIECTRRHAPLFFARSRHRHLSFGMCDRRTTVQLFWHLQAPHHWHSKTSNQLRYNSATQRRPLCQLWDVRTRTGSWDVQCSIHRLCTEPGLQSGAERSQSPARLHRPKNCTVALYAGLDVSRVQNRPLDLELYLGWSLVRPLEQWTAGDVTVLIW